MTTAILIVFVIGYLAIALEHPLRIDKASAALATGVLCWTIYALWGGREHASEQLAESFGEISGILFFLMGAMTIVELVDAFEGFSPITSRVRMTSRLQLMWAVSILTFFLSAALDNLTTTIVVVSLLKKLVADRKDRLRLAGLVILAANSGGAWTVIGDVTTTLLWIQGRIDPVNVMIDLFVPSLVCMVTPLLILTPFTRGHVTRPVLKAADGGDGAAAHHGPEIPVSRQIAILLLGLAGLLAVPAFKTFTHLPPFMGMMLSLSVLWLGAEILNHGLPPHVRSGTQVVKILRRIDLASVLFFLGVLLAVACLGANGMLDVAAETLNRAIGNQDAIALLIGLLSSVVDNVPLVAAGIEMYDYPVGHPFWTMLAYCAGTGGSFLIIGSAAGVAAMGLEKIDFLWYVRNISLLALIGYLAGAAAAIAQHHFIGFN
ncbi:sodium:proton antiporter NhaD [Candidatus Laterigemmans baculatus]|uniref:sodium:proton antiporter NhaD n=1 Tax=Candidatus Laterigemmans baculatus TaxID=2770505 RepID=UPI0013DC4C6B|nr:sodium:proton antiporter NhaD [Candidatus Laterigemmans baculatus]